MKINPKKPSLKRLWMRVHQNIQNLFLKGVKPTFPKREMLFTAGIQEHYKIGTVFDTNIQTEFKEEEMPSL